MKRWLAFAGLFIAATVFWPAQHAPA